MVSKNGSFRGDIQGLRAVAVLMVVASHAGIPGTTGGFAGVDVFFVISGFLITGLLIKEATKTQGISIPDFYARRARRILPAGTLVVVVTCIAAYTLLGTVRFSALLDDLPAAAFFVANWKFATDGTDYFAATMPPSPLQHVWSLSVEEQFYIVWPALVAAILFLRLHGRRSGRQTSRRASDHRWPLLLATIGLLTAASLAYSIIYTKSNLTAAYFSTFTRAWELGVGAILALVATKLTRIPAPARAAMSWLGVAGIVASIIVLREDTPFPGSAALLPVLSAAAVIAGGHGEAPGGAKAALSVAPLRWIGDRSYSLYLWHWPALTIGAAYFGDLTWLQTTLLVAGSLLASMASYSLVERPVHTGWKNVGRPAMLILWPASAFVIAIAHVAGTAAVVDRAGSSADAAGFTSGIDQPAPVDGAAASATPAAPADDVAAAVQAAVALTGPVPPNLSPSVATARDDNWENGIACGLTGPGQTSTAECTIGDKGAARSIALIGDSHAGMWLPALSKLASDSGWKVYPFVKYGCTSADVPVYKEDKGGVWQECSGWRAWAMAQVADLAPDVTIVSNRADFAAVAGPNGEVLAKGRAITAYRDGLAATLTTLKASSSRVIALSDVPNDPEDPIDCLDRPGADLADCTFPIGGTATANDTNLAAATVAAVEFADLTSWFCYQGDCPTVVNNMIVYFDQGHVTRTYGEQLASYLAERLQLQ